MIGVSCLAILAAATVLTTKKSKKAIEFEAAVKNVMKKNDA